MSQLGKIISDALQAVEEDRKQAKELLKDVGTYLGKDPSHHATVGLTAVKYLENLQKSNEQRVKLVEIMSRKVDGSEFGEISDTESTEIYEAFEDEDNAAADAAAIKEREEDELDGTEP